MYVSIHYVCTCLLCILYCINLSQGRRDIFTTVYCFGGGECKINVDSSTNAGTVSTVLLYNTYIYFIGWEIQHLAVINHDLYTTLCYFFMTHQFVVA